MSSCKKAKVSRATRSPESTRPFSTYPVSRSRTTDCKYRDLHIEECPLKQTCCKLRYDDWIRSYLENQRRSWLASDIDGFFDRRNSDFHFNINSLVGKAMKKLNINIMNYHIKYCIFFIFCIHKFHISSSFLFNFYIFVINISCMFIIYFINNYIGKMSITYFISGNCFFI